MPFVNTTFRAVKSNTRSGGEYSLEYEFTTLTVRIYRGEVRIGSFTVISSGAFSARITDLTLREPYRLTRTLFRGIGALLRSLNYTRVNFERQIGRGNFVVKEYDL